MIEYTALEQIVRELSAILAENDFLRERNKYLQEQVDRYDANVRESIKHHDELIGEILTSLIPKSVSEDKEQ